MSRIQKELVQISNNDSIKDIIDVRLKNEDNLYELIATIVGPKDSVYNNHKFDVSIKLLHSYPYDPPTIKFITPIPHPNVNNKGSVCMSILKKDWQPSMTIISILLSLISLLADPAFDDPLNLDLANFYKNDTSSKKIKYNNHVKKLLR
jgi:ubiquitin-protein ligase